MDSSRGFIEWCQPDNGSAGLIFAAAVWATNLNPGHLAEQHNFFFFSCTPTPTYTAHILLAKTQKFQIGETQVSVSSANVFIPLLSAFLNRLEAYSGQCLSARLLPIGRRSRVNSFSLWWEEPTWWIIFFQSKVVFIFTLDKLTSLELVESDVPYKYLKDSLLIKQIDKVLVG